MTIGLIIVVDGTNFFKPTHFQWSKGLYPITGPLDYQHGLSLEDCVSLCWEEDGCKSLNYHRHATLCELNRVDIASSLPTDLKDDKMSIYSEKISWTEVCKYTHGKKLRNTSSPIFKLKTIQLPVALRYWIFDSTPLKALSTYFLNY